MMGLRLLLTGLMFRCVYGSVVNISVDFFEIKKLHFVTAFLCNDYEKLQLAKKLAESGVRVNFPNLEKSSYDLNHGLFNPTSQMTGVLITMDCNQSEKILNTASVGRFFDITRHWLIFTPESFDQTEFAEIAELSEPEMFDVPDFLDHENSQLRYGERIKHLNKHVNHQVLSDPMVTSILKKRTKRFSPKSLKEKLISFLVDLKAIVDSEVTLAVPSNTSYEFFEIYRQTWFTKMIIKKMNLKNIRGTSAISGRKNFNGTLLRSTAPLLYYDYYSRTDNLPTQVVDQWAIKGVQMAVMAEERYNFRMIIKCLDDYGWAVNGTFTGTVKHLAEQRSDMTAGGLLLVDVRMGGITYVASSYKVRLDLFFEKPALSQVADIFVLPFAKTVWLSVISLLFFTTILLVLQFRLIEKLEQTLAKRLLEIFTFVTGAVCQQGTDLSTNIVSARVTMLVFLIASLFLFTSYTANIVSLLQSSSNAINTVREFLESSMEMGSEDLPYQVNLIEGDSDPLIRELFQKKLAEKKMKGTAYLNATTGMKKMRQEFYAFHMETEAGSRIMAATFSESEKCFIKTIPLFPNRFNGHAVPKRSPFVELLKQFYVWYEEIGFLQRNEARFGYTLPKCAGKGTSGFNNIGLSDIYSIVTILQYGIVLSFVLMISENLYYRFKIRGKKQFVTRIGQMRLKRKQTEKNIGFRNFNRSKNK